jgi:hypothetical protein
MIKPDSSDKFVQKTFLKCRSNEESRSKLLGIKDFTLKSLPLWGNKSPTPPVTAASFGVLNQILRNKTLIQNWNSSVDDRDEIYILGDLIFKGTGMEVDEIVKKLNG